MSETITLKKSDMDFILEKYRQALKINGHGNLTGRCVCYACAEYRLVLSMVAAKVDRVETVALPADARERIARAIDSYRGYIEECEYGPAADAVLRALGGGA